MSYEVTFDKGYPRPTERALQLALAAKDYVAIPIIANAKTLFSQEEITVQRSNLSIAGSFSLDVATRGIPSDAVIPIGKVKDPAVTQFTSRLGIRRVMPIFHKKNPAFLVDCGIRDGYQTYYLIIRNSALDPILKERKDSGTTRKEIEEDIRNWVFADEI